ncbi:unnamed protein product [Brassicogethes aeneus]|uniref:LRRCT domain-containing protein n=1 Tax=Brassicogethes aeneus TaxID=1431903 RepID=A0A9P0FCD7_BRAAE|nr:unnamed protein product [Brassicogethes aeneus]
MAITSSLLFTAMLCTLCGPVLSGYVPPGPLYRCPKDKQFLHPCTCDTESDAGVTVSCNNTNLASMSVALNNLAAFNLPVESLLIYKSHIGRFYGSLLYKLHVRMLKIEDTPIEKIEEHTFLGINNTLNELHLINTELLEFPTAAFKILGNLTVLNINGHKMTSMPKDAFALSDMTGRLLKLHICNGTLSTPPLESFQPLRKLRLLDLHGNRIQELKRNQFKGLRDVENLDLSHNNISKVDSSHLADLTKLGWFNVSHNNIGELTRGAFGRNTLLKVLNMSHNKIKRLDSNSFRGMRFMRRLFLSDNLITDVGRGTFGPLKRIGTIDLARNFLKKVDYQMFYELNFIEVLDLTQNNITVLEKNAFKDLYLSTILLRNNNISKIEEQCFINCANITLLDLSHNNLSNLSKKAFDETTYATELQLSYNFFTELSQIPLHNMTGIKILNVSHNNIWRIPKKTFPKLYELHTIDMSYNNVSDIFNAVFQTLFSLRYLDLSHNSMAAIKPSTFGPLPTLLKLDLSYNGMTTVAKSSLTRLASMRELILRGNNLKNLFLLPISTSHMDLSYNNFEEIPSNQWPSMNSLLHLDLSHNKLGDNLVHGSFAGLLTLQRLNLNYNGMTLPPWAAISELTSLQYLYLEGNNLTKLERNAFGRLPVVFELNLAHNNLYNISSRAFEGLLQVLVLNFTNNNLTYIPNGAFQGLVALQTLDLSHNKIGKIDNKTHGLLDDCLSLERLNLSHNKMSFLSRKTFPSNQYIPYKLREVDLSYNIIPVITFDLTFGTSKLEKLNLSHNAISDIRKFVMGNLTRLKVLDMSYNKLYDLTSERDFFRLPANLTELYLSHNQLPDLPWPHLMNASHISVLDVRDNLFNEFGPDLTNMVVARGTDVYFEGNPLHCDCFLRPLTRHLQNQLTLSQHYKDIECASPAYLSNVTLFALPEDRLNCPVNVNTTRIKESRNGRDYDVTPDFRFRELSIERKKLKILWRVMKNADIADTYVFIRNVQNPENVVFETTLPYFKRKLEIPVPGNLTEETKLGREYQICLLAKDSKTFVRKFYAEQCRDLSDTFKSSAPGTFYPSNLLLTVLLCVILKYVV